MVICSVSRMRPRPTVTVMTAPGVSGTGMVTVLLAGTSMHVMSPEPLSIQMVEAAQATSMLTVPPAVAVVGARIDPPPEGCGV